MSDRTLAVVLAVLTAVGGTAVSMILFRLSRVVRRPVYMLTGNLVVRDGEDIEVRFRGEQVPRVTRTLVFFWNAGRESIRSEDVREPARIRVNEGSMLRAKLVRTTRPEIRAHLEMEQETAVIRFSHLDRADGCCVEVLHTGEDTLGVTASAVVIGVRSGLRFLPSPFWDDPVGVWLGSIVAVAGAAVAVGSVVKGAWGASIGGLLALLFGARTAVASRRRDKRFLPREFWELPIPQNPSATGGITGWRLR